ncbi:helix-turn-helix domain-containing protein [Mycolicibacterium llatzerense]|uniref:helix-turn-helix domain-containing protein n=1 Tax=Mycolicibacterium llatzerense TaxID=280871 RepID=UPI0008DDBCAC|nr:helix-turn-helix transcriptional regulator [Mycolicibacterium llatzerense]
MYYRKRPRQSAVDTALFAERLNNLFATIHPPARGPYRNSEVTQALARRGHVLSDPYLSQLRRGIRTRPSPQTVQQLAEFFGVRTEYLDGRDSRYTRALDGELDWLRLARDESVREVTTALLALPSGVREDLLESTGSLANRGEPAVNHPRGIRLDVVSIDA